MHSKKILSALFLLFVCCTNVRAQSLSGEDRAKMRASEDSLLVMADSMFNAFIPDYRIGYCEKFVKQLVRALKTPGSYDYPFDSLRKVVNIISPEDKSFRIFNWVIAFTDVNTRYYGAIQMAEQDLKLYPLFDYTAELGKGMEDSVLRNGKWFGALYYNIITREVDDTKYYTLFGKHLGLTSTQKVLDPMYFSDKGIVFGAPLFQGVPGNNRPINRFIIEYKKGVSASMNWDDELHMIFFDRLVSQINDPNRKYTFVPSGQYDGFKWDRDHWSFTEDLIPVQTFKDGEAPAPKPLGPK